MRVESSSVHPPRKVAWVTGASGSLGRAMCFEFARRGFDLVLHFRAMRPALRVWVHELESTGSRVAWVTADLSRPSVAKGLCAKATKAFGRLDVLVNSASGFFPTSGGGRPEDWDLLFRTNAVTPYFLAREAAKSLGKTGGSVINLLDTYADHPVLKDHGAYLASKAALATLTRLLAVELAPHVRVNAVAPGAITFPASFSLKERRRVVQKGLLQKAGRPEDVAEAVGYLAEASYVTGQVLRVDGGRFV